MHWANVDQHWPGFTQEDLAVSPRQRPRIHLIQLVPRIHLLSLDPAP